MKGFNQCFMESTNTLHAVIVYSMKALQINPTTDFIFTQKDLSLLFLFVNLKLMNFVLMQTISSRNMLEMKRRQTDRHGEAC